MYKLLILFLGLIIPVSLSAHEINGQVCDVTNKPIPYANIILLARDSSFVTGTVSDSLGKYVFKELKGTDFILKCSSLGYKTIYKVISDSICNFMLQKEAITLKEVEVRAKMPVYHTVPGGYSTNVQNTILSDLGNADDVISSMPRVHGDNGNFIIFGKGIPEIYINNRKVNDKNELYRLESQNIKSITILTTPGAEYGSETNSVILIKTKKTRGQGISTNIDNYITQGHKTSINENAYINLRKKKWDAFANFGYIHNNSYGKQNVEQNINGNQNKINEKYSDYRYKGKGSYLNVKLGTDYLLNNSNSLGVSCTIDKSLKNPTSLMAYQDFVSIDNSQEDNIDYNTRFNTKSDPSCELNGYYEGQISKVNISFNTTYLRNKNDIHGITCENSNSLGSRIISTHKLRRNNMFASKLVLTYPFSKNFRMDLGYENYHSRIHQSYDNKEDIIESSVDKILENNLALFSTLSYTLDDFGINAGLRYEHVNRKYYQNGIKNNDQSHVYNQLFPTISASYDAEPLQLELSYSTTATRPTYDELSNIVAYNSRYLYEGGNPLLKTTFEHSLDFEAIYQFINLSLSYEYDRNPIVSWGKRYGNTSDIILLTNTNINKEQYLLGTLALTPEIGIWHPSLEFDYQKQFIDHTGLPDRFEKPCFQISIDNKFAFKNHLMLGSDYSYHTTFNDGYAKSYNNGALNFFVSKEFFKRVLFIKLYFYDVFNNKKDKNYLYTPFYNVLQTKKSDSRRIMLTVSFRMNNVHKRYKGTGAGNSEKSRL